MKLPTEIHKAYQWVSAKYPQYRFGYDKTHASLSVSDESIKHNIVAQTVSDGTAREYSSQYLEMLQELKNP